MSKPELPAVPLADLLAGVDLDELRAFVADLAASGAWYLAFGGETFRAMGFADAVIEQWLEPFDDERLVDEWCFLLAVGRALDVKFARLRERATARAIVRVLDELPSPA